LTVFDRATGNIPARFPRKRAVVRCEEGKIAHGSPSHVSTPSDTEGVLSPKQERAVPWEPGPQSSDGSPPGGMARRYRWRSLGMVVTWDGSCWRGPGGGGYTAQNCLEHGESMDL